MEGNDENIYLLTKEKKKMRETWLMSDWKSIRRTLFTAAIINAFIGIYTIFKMYENQKIIMFRLDRIESNQEAINSEIINLYKYEQR